jgi:hypothetical protein
MIPSMNIGAWGISIYWGAHFAFLLSECPSLDIK